MNRKNDCCNIIFVGYEQHRKKFAQISIEF